MSTMKMFCLCTVILLFALAFLTNPDVARAQNYRNCAWPIELSPEGSGNMLGPDTLSRYWVMPFDKQDANNDDQRRLSRCPVFFFRRVRYRAVIRGR